MRYLYAFLFVWLVGCASAQNIQDDLHGQGLSLYIHGAPQDLGHIVGSMRIPDPNVPLYEYYSLTTDSDTVKVTFAKLKRHDQIRVWGDVDTENHSQQKHLVITSIVIETPTDISMPEYKRKADLTKLPAADVPFRALVHAIIRDKKVLVVEYQDAVLPIQVPSTMELPDLYKNDIVELKAKIAHYPVSPVHLSLIDIKQKEALVALHGKQIDKTGALVFFPKSPEIQFDVYAIQDDLGDGLTRQFTVLNFEDPDLFTQIRDKLESFWKAGDQTKIVNGRNKLVNPTVQVHVKGIGNVVDRGQANPQIIVSNLNDIELLTDTPAKVKLKKK